MTATLARKHVRFAARGERFHLVGKDKRSRVNFHFEHGTYSIEVAKNGGATIWASQNPQQVADHLREVAL